MNKKSKIFRYCVFFTSDKNKIFNNPFLLIVIENEVYFEMNKEEISILETLAERLEDLSKKMEKAYNEERIEKFKKLKKEFLETQKKFSNKIK